MEATSAGLTTGTLGAFTVVHGAAAQIALTGTTTDLASGATRVLTATIQDAAGNTVTSDNTTVVAFAKASGAGTVSGTGNATATRGVATKTITGQLAGTVTMEATSAGLTTGTLGAFSVVHGAATQIALTGSTADLTSGATRVLTATLEDAAGNTVTSDNTTVVAFAKQSGIGTVSGTGNAPPQAGVATKTITGLLAGSVTMEATAAGLTTGTLGSLNVVHGAATRIDLTESGSTASGDNHALTATIEDAAGNTVTSDSTTVVSFAKTGGAGTVTGLGSATASSGVATKVVVNVSSGQIDLDAQAAGLTTGTASYTIVAGSGSTLTTTITASPTSLVANGSSTSAITVQLKDAVGNDLAGTGGLVALGLTGTGSLSAVTDNGDGTYSATLTAPTSVGSATVTGTLNAAALADTAAVTFVHGPATQIALAESGSNVAGDAHTLTATIKDAHGNTVTSDSSTVVAFAKTGGAGTVTGLGSAAAAGGVATKTLTNQLAGQIDVDAQAAGLSTGTASYTITSGPVSPAASDSTVVAAPGVVYANGLDAATITVTLRDAGGNGISGKTVTLTQGSGGSSITGGGSTNASGVVTFSATDTAVETVTYSATDTTDSITLADDATVNFTFADGTAPTNTVTLGSATRAWLTGTTLYYNGAAGGSFTLSSAVADGGSGPASAAYPAVSQPGWAHGAETISTPAGGPYVSSTISFNAGSTGNFTYDVTASDAWTPPNTAVTTLNVTEDSTAPAPSILCNGSACSAGWYTASPVSVTLAAPDAGAGLDQIRYTIDGTDPTVLTGSVYAGAFTVAAEGVTTVKYRAFDRIGNDSGVLTQAVRIDTVAPDTTIDSAPSAATQDTTPTFAFSSTEAGSTFQVRVDGGAWTTETSPLTLGPLAESTYAFDVRAIDAAGNVDATPASFTFTVDTTPANTTITSSPPAASNSTSASFSFTASDAGPGFECRLDGGAFADCSSPKSYAGLTEAAHTFEVRAEDAAGNVDATPATHAWTVDLTAPDTSLAPTPSNPSASATPTFGLGSTESPSTFECDLDGVGWAPCTTPFTTPSLGDGSHTLKARATDAAANTDATEATFTWLVDATAPTGSITAPANGAAVGGTIVLASDSADAGSGVATVLFQRSPAGAGTWTGQAASWDTTAQGDGDYDLRVVTTDGAGNAFTSATITVTVDNTDPSLSVVAPNPVNLATADPANVSATAGDAGSGIANVRFDQCAEDSPTCVSDSWVLLGVDTGAPYEASWPIPSDGPRLLRVRATDNAGKQKTELVLITIDRIRPSGSPTAPVPGADLRGAAVALAATATDTAPGTVNTVTFQRSPAGVGTWTDVSTDSSAPYTGTLDTTALAEGLYDLRVFTTDAAGNAEAAPATIQVRVDNTLPTGAATAPAAGANVRGTIALTSSSADAGSGVATVQFQRSPAGTGTWTNQAAGFDTTTVTDGQYDLRVTTTDNAGNTFTSPSITVRVDNTLPTGAVTAPAAGANVRGTIALTSSSADTGSGVATIQFQRSPAGTGTWTNQAAGFDTTTVTDGQYDLRVTTTDNAGNTFTSPSITVRVDNTLPTGSITAPADGAEIGVPPDGARERLGRRGRLGRRLGRVRAQPGRSRYLVADGGELEHCERPGCGCRRQLRPTCEDDRQRRQRLHVVPDHGARRPHGAHDVRVARARLAEQRAGHRQLLRDRRYRLGRRRNLLPRRRRQHPARHGSGRSRSRRPLERRLAPGRVLRHRRGRQRRDAQEHLGRDRHDGSERLGRRPRHLPSRDREPELLDRCCRRQLGPVPVLARGRRRVVEHRRSRHRAAVHGLLEHGARRRRALRPARRRHRHDRQRRQHAAPGLAEDGRQHRPGRLDHRSRRRRLRLRRGRGRRERHRRRGPACFRGLGRALRGQARRRRCVRSLRHADRTPLRLDLPADAGDDGARRWPRRAPSRRHRRRRQRDDLGFEHDQRRQRRAGGHARRPGCGRRRERQPDRVILRRHGRRQLPLPDGRHVRSRHRDRLGLDGAVRCHLDDGSGRGAAVGADRCRDRRRRQRHHERAAHGPRRPHAAHRRRHRLPRRARTSADRLSPWPPPRRTRPARA